MGTSHDSEKLTVLVYGAGAVGQALGCILAADGHTVDMVLRKRFIPVMNLQGLSVTGIFGDFTAPAGSFGVLTDLNDANTRQYDYTLITTKSYDTLHAVETLSARNGSVGTVVSLQNGCGNLEHLITRFGSDRVLAGRVITGFEIERPGIVRITVTADDIHIGGDIEGVVPSSASVLAEAIRRAGVPCSTTPFIRRDLYAKLLYNCALNPLGAVLGVRYGLLGENMDTCAVMDAVIGEVFDVLGAMRAETHWQTPDEYRRIFYDNLLPATAHHRPSMLQDIEHGKKTEVDALTGYVSAMGHEQGVLTPVCDTLSAQIRFLELAHRSNTY